jgi:hypothetical protein
MSSIIRCPIILQFSIHLRWHFVYLFIGHGNSFLCFILFTLYPPVTSHYFIILKLTTIYFIRSINICLLSFRVHCYYNAGYFFRSFMEIILYLKQLVKRVITTITICYFRCQNG